MILTCPACGTRYQADSAQFSRAGRNVRCAKCGHVWHQTAPDIEPEPEPEPARIPAESSEPASAVTGEQQGHTERMAAMIAKRPDTAAAPPGGAARLLGWVALMAVVAAILGAAFVFRQTIVSLWPQSASLYALIGAPVNARGIAIDNVAYRQSAEDGQTVATVTGTVRNITDRELAVTTLLATLTDGDKHELYHWTFDTGVTTLAPGAQQAFTQKLSNPPPEARNVTVRFARAGETQ